MWSFSIKAEEYLADIVLVKTRSFGPQWRPHQLMSTDEVSIADQYSESCQLMRSPLRTETPSLDKNNIG